MREKELSENQSKPTRPYRYHEGILSAVSVGAVFILIGSIFVTTQGLWEKIVAFLSDFTSMQVPGTEISLPAPAVPAAHAQLYTAVSQFSYRIGHFGNLAGSHEADCALSHPKASARGG